MTLSGESNAHPRVWAQLGLKGAGMRSAADARLSVEPRLGEEGAALVIELDGGTVWTVFMDRAVAAYVAGQLAARSGVSFE